MTPRNRDDIDSSARPCLVAEVTRVSRDRMNSSVGSAREDGRGEMNAGLSALVGGKELDVGLSQHCIRPLQVD